ncbi:MAG: c-type cytochrome domain-containing protein, partial [Verrucomicrobiota bacterium]|nr:c-type cytochrome domain-containing protein [Verrucomicrobiota bacterium]
MKYLIYPLLSLSICFGLSAVEDQNSLKVFESVIQPVFSAKCIHCHGTEKNKGKLRMHTKEDLLKGGSGAGEDMIVAGDSESSELIFRITLPKEDDEAMPPLEDEEHYN